MHTTVREGTVEPTNMAEGIRTTRIGVWRLVTFDQSAIFERSEHTWLFSGWNPGMAVTSGNPIPLYYLYYMYDAHALYIRMSCPPICEALYPLPTPRPTHRASLCAW